MPPNEPTQTPPPMPESNELTQTPLASTTEPQPGPIPAPTASPTLGTISPQQTLTPVAEKPHTHAGQLILQWITYALWGWSLLAISGLVAIVYNSLLGQPALSMLVPYAFSGTLVLIIGALIADTFYRKQEPEHKQGAAMAIMVIHAVIFVLFGVAATIACIVTATTLLMNTGGVASSPSLLAAVLSWATIAILYAATFFRTLNPARFARRTPLVYDLSMIIITLIFVVLAFIGPFVQIFNTRNDRRIEQGLPVVQSAIGDYIRTNNTLPQDLSALTLQGDTMTLVKDNLVHYRNEGKNAADSTLHYQLCVTYQAASLTTSTTYSYGYISSDYTTMLSTTHHPKGDVCYKLKAFVPNQSKIKT